MVFGGEIASAALARRNPGPTTICFGFRLLGLFGRPPGLPEKPVVKLVKRNQQRGIVSHFGADSGEGPDRALKHSAVVGPCHVDRFGEGAAEMRSR